MSKWQGDGYTDEQRAFLNDLVAKLPPAPCCPDESRLVRDLRGMLASQARVSEQHHTRVQELSARLAAAEAALARGRKVIVQTIEAVTPEPCRCAPMEFCSECLPIKTLEQALAALAGGRERAAEGAGA